MNFHQDTIGKIPFANHLWNGPQILGWFFLFSTLIVFISYWNVKFLKIIGLKFNISSVFVGGVLLSIITSMPEFVTGVFAGIEDKAQPLPTTSLFSFYNVVGANNLQIFILAAFALYFSAYVTYSSIKRTKQKVLIKAKTNKNITYGNVIKLILKGNGLILVLVFIECFLIFILLLAPKFGDALIVNGFSFLNLIFLIFWLVFLVISLFQKGEELGSQKLYKSFFWKINRFWTLGLFLVIATFFVFIAYLNSGLVDKFEQTLNIPVNVGGGFILSLATSLPEISSFLSLVYRKNYETAVSGILGSSIFNLSIPFYTNVISLNPLYGSNVQKMAITNDNAARLMPWMAFSLCLIILLVLGANKKTAYWKVFSTSIFALVFVAYIVVFAIISIYPHL